jgi:plasmid replication initiation protein
MKKIISFSLWGDNKIYHDGVYYNYNIIQEILPDYKMRVYVDGDLKSKIDFGNLNIELIFQKSLTPYHGMYWRFFACEDCDIALIRDLDSRISLREVALIREWETSRKSFHIIRDHPLHKMPIMGGCWGCRNSLKNIRELVNLYGIFENYNDDQIFLQKYIFPIMENDCIEHVSNDISFTKTPIKIKKSIDGSFIGERIKDKDTPCNDADRKIYLDQ